MASSPRPKRTQVDAIAAGGPAYYANHTRSVQLNTDETGRHPDAVLNTTNAASDAKAMTAEQPATQPLEQSQVIRSGSCRSCLAASGKAVNGVTLRLV